MSNDSSSWQWCKQRSNYHFDNTTYDQAGDYIHLMGRFVGDWSQELDQVLQQTHSVTWSTRKNYQGQSRVSPMLAQELYDLESVGADPDLVLTDRMDYPDQVPVFARMIEYFGMENCRSQIHIQRTGQMFNLHIDKLYEYADRAEDVFRFVVMLADWEPGQFYCYGTYQYTHWQAGDFHWFDWPNVPHATANASHTPRPTLQITGRATGITKQRINQLHLDPVFV
jgi:hypothetical protein